MTQEENAQNPEEPEEITHADDKTEGEGVMATPAQMAGIKIEGENEWLTLIQNAKH